MSTGKNYFARSSYRFLPGEREGAMIPSDSLFELDETDVWNATRSPPPEVRRPLPTARTVKKPVAKRGEAPAATSLPVNIPDWSKILREDYREKRRSESDDAVDDDDDFGDGGNRIPPHEFLARQLARTRIASFSLHEGIGRTLKGRDLSRVRNAIWEKTGFQD